MKTVRAAIATIAACAAAGGLAGGSLGFAVARFAPDYYCSIFRVISDPNFDPTSLGVGRGLTQGTTFGTVVGLVLVVVLAWREIRLLGPVPANPQSAKPQSYVIPRRMLAMAGGFLVLGF